MRTAASAVAFVCASSSAALAQVSTLPSREELDPSQRAPAPAEVRRDDGQLFAQPLSAPCAFEASDLRFTLESVEFQGGRSLSSAELAQAYEGLAGREIPLAEICRIRDRAASAYFDVGILARVEIPEQRISEGRLILQVFEASIAEVNVTGEAGPGRRQVERILGSLQGAPVFDMKVVQRKLLLASETPGMRVKATVRPSQAADGAVALDIAVSRDALDGTAAIQNYGSEIQGPWTGLARLDLNSFTPLGERTSLVVTATSDFEEQRVIQLLEQVPLNADGLVGRLSLAYGQTRPGGVLEPLGLEGTSVVGNLEAAWPMLRSRRRNIVLSGGLEWADQKTEFGSFVLTRDELRIATLRLEGDYRSQPGTLPVAAAGGIELRQGLDALGASEAGSLELSRFGGKPDATALRLDLRAEAAVAPRFSLGFRGQAQWSDDRLLSYEQISAGNYTIGRGYEPSTLSGDRGVAAAFEARYEPPIPFGASVFAFYDTASIKRLGAGSSTVDSVGGGVRLRLHPRFDVELTYANPLDDVPGADERLLVNLVTRLF